MARGNLHLNALRAFEAAARHASFTKAAEELCVTHSAISHQVKQLETLLGNRLFRRTNRGVELTDAGRTLLPVLADSFDRIAATLRGLEKGRGAGALRVTATPTFAAKWLVPRLADWRARHRDIGIHLHPALHFLDLAKGEADVGIRCGVPPWPGLTAELLLPIHMTPLCSQSLLEGGATLGGPRDLLNFTLIHADVTGHPLGEEWRLWLAAAGITDVGPLPGLSFHDPSLALQAAIDGLGVAIGYLELARSDIDAGRLVQPFALPVAHPFSYYLVYDKARLPQAEIGAFRNWILGEARADLDAA